MYKALVFQVKTKEDFSQNIMASLTNNDYIPFSKMEYVGYVSLNINITEKALEEVFCICNDETTETIELNYSMSVGDIVVFYNDVFRCTSDGWVEVEITSLDVKTIANIYEAIENKEREDNEMGTTGTEAKSIVGVVSDNLKSASEAALGLCNDVAKEAKTIAAMSQEQAESYIQRKFHKSADKFINWITEKLGVEIERSEDSDSWDAPIGETVESEDTSRLKKALADFRKVKAAGELKGWKKFKELLKAVFGIIFAVFVEVAKVVLKLAFTLAVGAIRVGACVITTLLSCAGIVKDDVVKPVYGAAKKAHNEHKARKAAKVVGVDTILDDDCFED